MIYNTYPVGDGYMESDGSSPSERVGRRIREIRTAIGMSQEELGSKVGLNADRIQKYEHGVRKPKMDLLKKIADALHVSIFALTDPDVTDEIGLMYALFDLERSYNLKVQKKGDVYSLIFGDGRSDESEINEEISRWYEMYELTQELLKSATSKEDKSEIRLKYRMWEWTYPDNHENIKFKELIKKQIDKLQKIMDSID